MDVPLIRRGFHQDDGRELIEKVFLQSAAKLETTNVRQTVVQKNQVRLHLQAASDRRFAICRLFDIALLALQESLQFIAIRRIKIH